MVKSGDRLFRVLHEGKSPANLEMISNRTYALELLEVFVTAKAVSECGFDICQ